MTYVEKGLGVMLLSLVLGACSTSGEKVSVAPWKLNKPSIDFSPCVVPLSDSYSTQSSLARMYIESVESLMVCNERLRTIEEMYEGIWQGN